MFLFFVRMSFRNAFRHRLRATLTTLGIVVAILSFGLLRTVVDAWYSGVDAASDARLVTRNAVSLVFPLPLAYKDRIRQVDGVETVSWTNWFGGIYIDESNFFPQFAVDAPSYFALYPELVFNGDEYRTFLRDKRGAAVGRKLANRFGWKVGDVVPLRGTIYPGNYQFVIRAIFDGKQINTDTNIFYFHWSLANDRLEQLAPGRSNRVGAFVMGIDDPTNAAPVSTAIDKEFKNSLAETLTETEKAFQLGFVAMLQTVVDAIKLVSYVVILIIMAVVANTMAMSARERTAEYATMKALGFSPTAIRSLIAMESLMLVAVGAGLGILLTGPLVVAFSKPVSAFFPVFNISDETRLLQLGGAMTIAVMSALLPAWQAGRVRIVDGLRKLV
ncbi:FtsX-like permease family protein [Chitinivorax sp. B]|uniref:ABC transporter permease n=1 Tax=Chitinivorax sp. B TaxID=2502235 RepID=UPI0010F89AF4|nr:FtsX-like permease family protein [Chitinivorax sp. B]